MSASSGGPITRLLEESTTERVLHRTEAPVELVVSDRIPQWERYAVPAVIAAAGAAIVATLMGG